MADAGRARACLGHTRWTCASPGCASMRPPLRAPPVCDSGRAAVQCTTQHCTAAAGARRGVQGKVHTTGGCAPLQRPRACAAPG